MRQGVAGRNKCFRQRIAIAEPGGALGERTRHRFFMVRHWTEIMTPVQSVTPSRKCQGEWVARREFHRLFEQFERDGFRRGLDRHGMVQCPQRRLPRSERPCIHMACPVDFSVSQRRLDGRRDP